MDNYNLEKIKRVTCIAGVVIFIGLVVWGLISLSGWIVQSSYDPRDVVADVKESVPLIPEDKTIPQLGIKTAEEASDRWVSVVADNEVDALIYKSAMLLTCDTSPFKEKVADVGYEISSGDGVVEIKWVFDDYSLSCVSTMDNGVPNVYIKSIPFTKEEKEFLTSIRGLGEYKEAEEDGTYSIYYAL